MKVYANTCVERRCDLANKKPEQLYRVSTPCMDDHQFLRCRFGNSWRIVESVFTRRPEMVVVGRIGRLHMTWSVKLLGKS